MSPRTERADNRFVMVTDFQQTADCYYLLIHNIPYGKFKSVLPIYPHG